MRWTVVLCRHAVLSLVNCRRLQSVLLRTGRDPGGVALNWPIDESEKPVEGLYIRSWKVDSRVNLQRLHLHSRLTDQKDVDLIPYHVRPRFTRDVCYRMSRLLVIHDVERNR